MLSTGCPGIILYGRRRMGKSTVLRNIAALLPSRVRVVTESLQNPQTFQSLEALVGRIVERIRGECPQLDLPPTGHRPERPIRWLSAVTTLWRTATSDAVGVDEYEQIDAKIGAGVFTRTFCHAARVGPVASTDHLGLAGSMTSPS